MDNLDKKDMDRVINYIGRLYFEKGKDADQIYAALRAAGLSPIQIQLLISHLNKKISWVGRLKNKISIRISLAKIFFGVVRFEVGVILAVSTLLMLFIPTLPFLIMINYVNKTLYSKLTLEFKGISTAVYKFFLPKGCMDDEKQ